MNYPLVTVASIAGKKEYSCVDINKLEDELS